MLLTNQAHVYQNHESDLTVNNTLWCMSWKKTQKHAAEERILKCYTGHSSRVSEVENITFLNSFLKYSEK